MDSCRIRHMPGFGRTRRLGVSAIELPTDDKREAAEIGLKYYLVRWYDSEIGHFIQVDSIVTSIWNPIMWNRDSYVTYEPVNYIDPSGHMVDEEGSNNPWKNTAPRDHGIYDLEEDVDILFSPPFTKASTSQQGNELSRSCKWGKDVYLGVYGAVRKRLSKHCQKNERRW